LIINKIWGNNENKWTNTYNKNIKGLGNAYTRKILSYNLRENYDLLGLLALLKDNKLFNKKIVINQDNLLEANSKALYDLKLASENSILITNIYQEDYPQMLLNSTNPPILLFYKGDISFLNKMFGIAIIGTREPSKLGEKIAYRYSEYVTKRGNFIASGLAKGIDTIAHQACIDNFGKTVAFIAHGLNYKIYPKENIILAQEIIDQGGVIISEYGPNIEPKPIHFIERDRLQSGVSKGVIVIETKKDGGSMHAARDAFKLRKAVGVVKYPGIGTMDREDLTGNVDLLESSGIPLYDKETVNTYLDLTNGTVEKNEMDSSETKQLEFDF